MIVVTGVDPFNLCFVILVGIGIISVIWALLLEAISTKMLYSYTLKQIKGRQPNLFTAKKEAKLGGQQHLTQWIVGCHRRTLPNQHRMVGVPLKTCRKWLGDHRGRNQRTNGHHMRSHEPSREIEAETLISAWAPLTAAPVTVFWGTTRNNAVPLLVPEVRPNGHPNLMTRQPISQSEKPKE